MKKSDLKTGQRVRTRDGKLWLVLKDCDTEHYGNQDLFFASLSKKGFLIGDNFSDDLINENYTEFDIVAVYNEEEFIKGCAWNIFDSNFLHLIWEREESKYKIGDKFKFEEITQRISYDRATKEKDLVIKNGIGTITSIVLESEMGTFYNICIEDKINMMIDEKDLDTRVKSPICEQIEN